MYNGGLLTAVDLIRSSNKHDSPEGVLLSQASSIYAPWFVNVLICRENQN